METNAPAKPTTRDVWMRGLFILILVIGFAAGQWLLNLIALVQFLWLLFAREPNGFLAASAALLLFGSRKSGAFSPAPPTASRSRGEHGQALPVTCLHCERPHCKRKSLKNAAFVPIFLVMSITDAKKTTKARQPRASALKSTASRKTAKPKTPVNGVATAYASRYAVGDHISHPMFGHGTVTAIDENKLTIEFPESVTKQIMDAYVTHRSP